MRRAAGLVNLTTLEDERGVYRRWGILKWAGRQMERAPKTVLLFGDPMRNGDAADGGYVGLIEKALKADGRTLTFVSCNLKGPRRASADIPAAARALAPATPAGAAPELVVFAPSGPAAPSSGTRRVRAGARCVDRFGPAGAGGGRACGRRHHCGRR